MAKKIRVIGAFFILSAISCKEGANISAKSQSNSSDRGNISSTPMKLDAVSCSVNKSQIAKYADLIQIVNLENDSAPVAFSITVFPGQRFGIEFQNSVRFKISDPRTNKNADTSFNKGSFFTGPLHCYNTGCVGFLKDPSLDWKDFASVVIKEQSVQLLFSNGNDVTLDCEKSININYFG
ncbi:MAG: hypothetical protein ACOYOK_15870 [Pseudobdellovibrionaceae bacterium]